MMEGVGIALNILPLMVSVAENYKKLFLTPLVRYRNFSNEASRYIVRLENQQAIFETHCLDLLSTVVDTPVALNLLEALPQQAVTTKEEVEERLMSVLGGSHTALSRTIKAIDDALLATQRDCKGLSEMVEEEDQGKKKKRFNNLDMISKGWKSHTGRKLKFSFSESHLSANLKSLSELTQDFVTLASFFKRPLNDGDRRSTDASKKAYIDRHRMIGVAAEEVWRLLTGLDCGGCEENYAYLGVGHETVKQYMTTSELAEFNVALSCIRTSLDLSRFLVTAKLQKLEDTNSESGIEGLTRALLSGLKIEKVPLEVLEKGVGDNSTARASGPAPYEASSSGREVSREDVQGKASDLCGFLNHPEFDRMSGPIQAFSACDEGAKVSNPKANCTGTPIVARSTTLHDLLENCSRDRPRNCLSVFDRLRLAKNLSVAYLRFHSTGWAYCGWQSRGVCFQLTEKDDMISDVTSLHMPYLQARVCSTSSFHTRSISQPRSALGLNTMRIFNLGVILLEIGYSLNWDTLNRVFPSQYRNDDPLSAVLQARLLLANGIFDMGEMYTKIVSKLVEGTLCNIVDADERKLEAAFMEAVVRPLEGEERRLSEFLSCSDPPLGSHS